MDRKGNVNDTKYQKLLSFRVPTGLYTQLMDIAREQGTTLTDAILYAIDKAFNGVGTIKAKGESEELEALKKEISELQEELEQKNKLLEEYSEPNDVTTEQDNEFFIDAQDKEFLRVISKKMTKTQGFEVTPSILLKNYIERVEMEREILPTVCTKQDVIDVYGKTFREVLETLYKNKKYLN